MGRAESNITVTFIWKTAQIQQFAISDMPFLRKGGIKTHMFNNAASKTCTRYDPKPVQYIKHLHYLFHNYSV